MGGLAPLFLMRQIEQKPIKERAATFSGIALVAVAMLFAFGDCARVTSVSADSRQAYLGFDLNDYPGDAALPKLRKTFAFSSYWISPPPGEKTNAWKGKRDLLRSRGFGFLVLYSGRDSSALKNDADAKSKGDRKSTRLNSSHITISYAVVCL